MKRFLTFFTLMSLCFVSLFAQEKTISGVVVDAAGEPVIGASVLVAGTNIGTITDYDGLFTISVPVSAKTLIISFVGMETQEVPVKDNLKVVLQESSVMVDEVIAVAYGNVSKGSFAGSAQAVSAESIEKKSPSEISKALAGEVAGVQVVNTSGQPGTNASIRIRGIGSVNSSSAPLYVVDGIPYEGDVSALDPGDIASTTILKDATATSLYGSRGANGVIVITTKKGNSGEEGKIDVDLKYGANMHLLPMYDVVTSPEDYVLLGWQGIYNTSKSINAANNTLFSSNGIDPGYNIWNMKGSLLINPYDAQGNVNPSFGEGIERLPGYGTIGQPVDSWYDAVFRVGQKAEATVKIHGGSEKTTYYTSFGYLMDEGYYQSSDFSRFSVRSNVEHQAKKWLKGGMNLQYAYTTMNNPNQDGDGAMNNGFLFVNAIPTIYPVYQRNADGSIAIDPYTGKNAYDYGMYEGGGRGFGAGINPAGSLLLDKELTTTHNFTGSAYLKATLYKGLTLTANVGMQYYGYTASKLTNKFYGDAAGVGRLTKQKGDVLAITANQLLEYNNSFADHNIRLLAGHETAYMNSGLMYGHKNYLILPNTLELGNVLQQDGSLSASSTEALESYLASVSYNYAERYYLNANYRADGSSRFAKGHRWGHFGSVGAAWVMTNEQFMADQDILKFFKLRASWGVLGNQALDGTFLYTNHYTVNNLEDEIALYETYRANPNLTWERTQTADVGLEFSIGKYLDAELDYFYKLTDNMVFTRQVASSNGYKGYYVNDAKMANQGVEFQLNVHAVDTRNVKLDIRLNGGHYANKMLEMPIDYVDADGTEHRMVMSGNMSEGHSMYDWYLIDYKGVDMSTGEALYEVCYDANKGGFGYDNAANIESGDNYISSLYDYMQQNPDADIQRTVTNNYTLATSQYVGKSAIPTLEGGFGLDLEVYGVTISAMLSYRLGGYGYDNTYAQLMHSDQVGKHNWHTDIYNAWTPMMATENQEISTTVVPRLSNGSDLYANAGSSRFLTKNNYLSLNNIRIGYSFPKKWMEKIKFQSLNIYVSGDNLALWSARRGFNPTVSLDGSSDISQYTPLSTIMGGIKFTF